MVHTLFKIYWMFRFRFRFFLHQKQGHKNVALVVNSFDKGGLEQVVLNLYLGYKKNGWNAYILSQSRNIGQMAEKLLDLRDIYIFDEKEDEFIRFCWEKSIDTLHYHYNTYMLMGARKMGFKVIYTMHNIYTWMSLPEICAYSYKLTAAHKIVPVSSFVEQYYLTRTQAPRNNIHTILNGVDFHELDSKSGILPVTRQSLGFKKSDVIVAEIASFHHVKHQIGLIGVMEALQKDYPEIKLLLVGNKGDINYYKEFEHILKSSSAKNSIKIIPYFDHKYMGRFLREVVDIFTLPTLQEGCSNAVLEALYCAKPMILTDVGNAGDIKDVAACIVVPPAYPNIVDLTQEDVLNIAGCKRNLNTDALVKAFIDMTENLDEYNKKAQTVAQNASVYSTEHMVEQYIELIQKMNRKER